jgi:hypothetical protein
VEGNAFLYMDGQAVFKLAVSVLEKVANEALEHAGMTADQIDWLIPHQANIRIMNGTAKKLGLPTEKMVVTVDQHGNTSAASIPLALDQAVRDGRIQKGQNGHDGRRRRRLHLGRGAGENVRQGTVPTFGEAKSGVCPRCLSPSPAKVSQLCSVADFSGTDPD